MVDPIQRSLKVYDWRELRHGTNWVTRTTLPWLTVVTSDNIHWTPTSRTLYIPDWAVMLSDIGGSVRRHSKHHIDWSCVVSVCKNDIELRGILCTLIRLGVDGAGMGEWIVTNRPEFANCECNKVVRIVNKRKVSDGQRK
jgi:hypothetical protein